jgi:hypothetical protein
MTDCPSFYLFIDCRHDSPAGSRKVAVGASAGMGDQEGDRWAVNWSRLDQVGWTDEQGIERRVYGRSARRMRSHTSSAGEDSLIAEAVARSGSSLPHSVHG